MKIVLHLFLCIEAFSILSCTTGIREPKKPNLQRDNSYYQRQTNNLKLSRWCADHIRTIYDCDQKYRLILNTLMANHNGAYYNQVVDSINKHDSINQTIVLSIVKQYGWPSSTYVGEFESIVFFLVIQHAGLKIQEEFLPFLIGLTYSNDFEKKDLAYLADRILMKNHHHQVFGTQLNLDSMTTTAICNSCQFPGYVNVLRREFCLGSLEDYIKQSNEMYLKK